MKRFLWQYIIHKKEKSLEPRRKLLGILERVDLLCKSFPAFICKDKKRLEIDKLLILKRCK